MPKRVLVAGGAGFIGSHLCERLLADGEHVLCVDNFLTGRRSNVESLLGHSRFELREHDVTVPIDAAVDQIYNLACPASPRHYQADPIQTMKVSVLGAINLLELATRLHVRILQASTSEVYGDPLQHPQTEDYWGHVNPIGPRACYNEGKRCAEALFFDYWREHKLPIRVARIFNTYGPRMATDDGRVVSEFIVAALRNEPLVLHGDGRQTRSFCYVDDIVDGLIALMNAADDLTGPINLGSSDECTITELAETVLQLTGSQSSIVAAASSVDDPRRRRPDVSRAKTCLGWEPKTDRVEGLERTIAHFRCEALRHDAACSSLSSS